MCGIAGVIGIGPEGRTDARVLIVFAVHLAVLFGAAMLAFNVPFVRELVLDDIMGALEKNDVGQREQEEILMIAYSLRKEILRL